MEVRLFPNSARAGVGQRPKQESQRPLLPQHARHCPVLEAGSAAGFLVYPPLAENEAFHVEFQGEGQYRFTFYMGEPGTQWTPLFNINYILPVGSVGRMTEQVEFLQETPFSPDGARKMARIFIVPEDLGTPTGGITLRGATNFQTPEAGTPSTRRSSTTSSGQWRRCWSFASRPIGTRTRPEFRYVLQPGEVIPGAHNLPIGQVLFVPREPITFRDCNEEELAAIKQSKNNVFSQQGGGDAEHAVWLRVQPALRTREPRAAQAGIACVSVSGCAGSLRFQASVGASARRSSPYRRVLRIAAQIPAVAGAELPRTPWIRRRPPGSALLPPPLPMALERAHSRRYEHCAAATDAWYGSPALCFSPEWPPDCRRGAEWSLSLCCLSWRLHEINAAVKHTQSRTISFEHRILSRPGLVGARRHHSVEGRTVRPSTRDRLLQQEKDIVDEADGVTDLAYCLLLYSNDYCKSTAHRPDRDMRRARRASRRLVCRLRARTHCDDETLRL